MKRTPRARILKAFNGANIDYNEIIEVLKMYITKSCEFHEKYGLLQEELAYLSTNVEKDELDEPYHELLKLALSVDIFSNLAHIKEDQGEYYDARFLRTQKDFIMTELANCCLNLREDGYENIGIGFKSDECEEALYVDLPHIGQLSWHFGNRVNLYGIMKNTDFRISQYRGVYESKQIRTLGVSYGNRRFVTW